MLMRARYIRSGLRLQATRRDSAVCSRCSKVSASSEGGAGGAVVLLFVMWRSPCVALLLSVLVVLWCGCVQSAPLFGLSTLFGGSTSSNSTGLLEALALSHLEHKINTLQVLEDLITIAGNFTHSGFG